MRLAEFAPCVGMSVPLTGFDNLNKEGARYILEHVVRNDNRIGTVWTKSKDVGEAIGPMLAKVGVARRAACEIVDKRKLIAS